MIGFDSVLFLWIRIRKFFIQRAPHLLSVVLMEVILGIIADLIIIVLALGAGVFAFSIRNSFRGGLLWRPWRIIGPSPFLFALGEFFHVLKHIWGDSVPVVDLLHLFAEVGFVAMLMYGFYLFNKVWIPKKK